MACLLWLARDAFAAVGLHGFIEQVSCSITNRSPSHLHRVRGFTVRQHAPQSRPLRGNQTSRSAQH